MAGLGCSKMGRQFYFPDITQIEVINLDGTAQLHPRVEDVRIEVLDDGTTMTIQYLIREDK